MLTLRGASDFSWGAVAPLRPAKPRDAPDQYGIGRRYNVCSNRTRGSAITDDELRRKNARLRASIDQILEKHPELRDLIEEIALRQDMHVRVGTPFLERVQAKLQERARAIIERRPELEHYFDD